MYGLSTTDYGEDFDKSDFQPDPRSEEVIVNLPQTGIVWAEATQIVVRVILVLGFQINFIVRKSRHGCHYGSVYSIKFAYNL